MWCGFCSLLQAETLVETVNTSTGVNQLLLAGIERVALGANFNLNVLLGRTGLNNLAARASDRSLFVLRMGSFLHCIHLFLVVVKGHSAPYFFKARIYYNTF